MRGCSVPPLLGWRLAWLGLNTLNITVAIKSCLPVKGEAGYCWGMTDSYLGQSSSTWNADLLGSGLLLPSEAGGAVLGGSHWALWRLAWVSACCCSLLRMMLMMAPSCSFMCSIRRSLLVDSKPQMQQQNRRTQYSMLGVGGGWPAHGQLLDCSGSFCWGGGASWGHWEESAGSAGTPEAPSVLAADGSGEGGSSLKFSFKGAAPAGPSATDSTTAANLWGALRVKKEKKHQL